MELLVGERQPQVHHSARRCVDPAQVEAEEEQLLKFGAVAEGAHRPVAGDGQRVARLHAGNIGAEPLAARGVCLGGVGGEERAEHGADVPTRRDQCRP